MSTRVDLVIDQGSTFNTTVDIENNTDLTGVIGRGQIRKHYGSTNAVNISVTCNTLTNEVTLSLPAWTTANMMAGRYVYDIELLYPDDTVIRLIEGVITVTPEVTKI